MCVGISDLCGIRWSFKSNEVKRDSALSEFSENEAKIACEISMKKPFHGKKK